MFLKYTGLEVIKSLDVVNWWERNSRVDEEAYNKIKDAFGWKGKYFSVLESISKNVDGIMDQACMDFHPYGLMSFSEGVRTLKRDQLYYILWEKMEATQWNDVIYSLQSVESQLRHLLLRTRALRGEPHLRIVDIVGFVGLICDTSYEMFGLPIINRIEDQRPEVRNKLNLLREIMGFGRLIYCSRKYWKRAAMSPF
jgi:hypothetical protein